MSREAHPEVEPLNKAEQAWVKRLEKVLLSCPSDRLGLITIGLKRPVGRPKTITDMKAYKREKAREYRSKLKLERENAK